MAGPVPSTKEAATPAALRAAKRLALVQPDICIPPVSSWIQCGTATWPATYFAPGATPFRDAIVGCELPSLGIE
ncbi:hypothetical protein MmonteBS_23680 [Mycobacterium montefiorense]|uniref:Uncharacterized protein n=1 Tax=Mycobacterium montefiorense TaxID=154654 RepID=A0ABQ0NM91_9MYCO|nr:hypothetical protein MmonteBS_23680 [Mycobacterium montefiorense]GKU33855.1 hypothetical protein NJB14191_12010 [Mycobacterium montefiorense]